MLLRFHRVKADRIERKLLFPNEMVILLVRHQEADAENLFISGNRDDTIWIERIISAVFYHQVTSLIIGSSIIPKGQTEINNPLSG